MATVYSQFTQKKDTPQIALLIDPDVCTQESIRSRMVIANAHKVDYIFLGGSLVMQSHLDDCLKWIKTETTIPVVLFPGNDSHIHPKADAVLLLSLISGRNADLLIGKHVQSAPIIRQFGLEAISTGYMLIESGPLTSVQYISNTLPIPRRKNDIAVSTAMAGEMLGLKSIYLDGGSGAAESVPAEMVREIKKAVDLPLLVGGGIRSLQTAQELADAGADILVFGSLVETDPSAFETIIQSLK